MPKEFIDNRYAGQVATEHGEGVCPCDGLLTEGGIDCVGRPVAFDNSTVKVGWTKDHQHVEIAILHDRDQEHDPNAWHSQFDRVGINRMIRVLRQARDDAFGKDA